MMQNTLWLTKKKLRNLPIRAGLGHHLRGRGGFAPREKQIGCARTKLLSSRWTDVTTMITVAQRPRPWDDGLSTTELGTTSSALGSRLSWRCVAGGDPGGSIRSSAANPDRGPMELGRKLEHSYHGAPSSSRKCKCRTQFITSRTLADLEPAVWADRPMTMLAPAWSSSILPFG